MVEEFWKESKEPKEYEEEYDFYMTPFDRKLMKLLYEDTQYQIEKGADFLGVDQSYLGDGITCKIYIIKNLWIK